METSQSTQKQKVRSDMIWEHPEELVWQCILAETVSHYYVFWKFSMKVLN